MRSQLFFFQSKAWEVKDKKKGEEGKDSREERRNTHQIGFAYDFLRPIRLLVANCVAPQYPNGTNSTPSGVSDTVRSSTRSSLSPTRQEAMNSIRRCLVHCWVAYPGGALAQRLGIRARGDDVVAVHFRAVPTPSRARAHVHRLPASHFASVRRSP
jgi:hypothetical protein